MIALKLLCIFGGLGLGSGAATQWVAAQCGYHPQLGEALITLGHLRFYAPYQFYTWALSYAHAYPTIIQRGYLFACGGVLVGVGGSLVIRVLEARRRTQPSTYGTSRWATASEMQKQSLFDDAGVILGTVGNNYIRHNGPEHIIVAGATRSGKGAGVVVPTLLTNCDSTITHDVKEELWGITAGWRSKFSRCVYYNPTSLASARYNPMAQIRTGPEEVKDTQNIADILVDPEGSRERRDHWEKTSHSLLVGSILHVLYAEREKSLPGVDNFLADPARTFDETLDVMMRTVHVNGQVHPVVARTARELKNKSPNELSGVLSTALSFLSLYRDPIVARATSESDFHIEDICNGSRPMSLYLCLPPSDISRTRPLMRLILNQIGRRLTESLAPTRHNLLWILDEFVSLGRLDFFETALGYFAGYGIRALMTVVSLNALDLYGTNNAIFDNCHIRVAFTPNDDRPASRLSRLLGVKTVLRRSRNLMGNRFSMMLDRTMVSEMETPRDLMTTSEIMQLPSDEELILVGSFPPIKAKKVQYFTDQTFLERVLEPPRLVQGPRSSPVYAGVPVV